jgi:hypothetical protein
MSQAQRAHGSFATSINAGHPKSVFLRRNYAKRSRTLQRELFVWGLYFSLLLDLQTEARVKQTASERFLGAEP